MAWRAAGGGAATPVATPQRMQPHHQPRGKPTIAAIAQIEKAREDRRKAMAAAKMERQQENLRNEKHGQPGDVDFQRMIKGFREQNQTKSQPHSAPGDIKITICVRKRPVNTKEIKKRDFDAVTCLNPMAIVHDCKLKVDGITKYLDSNAFEFDHTFDENSTNEMVYNFSAQPLVKFVFYERGRATVFAYGQTGSGKTHTMTGIQKNIAADVFAEVHTLQSRGIHLDVCVSFFEIYGGRCQDLLHRKRLTIREDGAGEVQIVDLEEVQPQSTDELLEIIRKGNSLRTTHATEMNDVSSRSHSICQIIFRERGTSNFHGKISLIDLAGSERGEDTKNHNRQRRMESSEINKSLLALKECFRALDSGGRGAHIPFRASKLTQVLKDSFVNAKARTVMIAAVSPCSSSSDHTLNTLRYADRVKEKHVSANAFDDVGEHPDEGGAVALSDVQFETDAEDDLHSQTEDFEEYDEDCENDSRVEMADHDNSQDEGHQLYGHRPNQSDVAGSSSENEMHYRELRDRNGEAGADYESGACRGVAQTLYESQESLLNAHMNAIQESAELLTEEGALLADIQGDAVVDYDIDRYVSRLDEILAQKADTINALRQQLSAFRKRCEEEERTSRSVLSIVDYTISFEIFQNTKDAGRKMVLTRAARMTLRAQQRAIAQRDLAQLCVLNNGSHVLSANALVHRNAAMISNAPALAAREAPKRSWAQLAVAGGGLMAFGAATSDPSRAEGPQDDNEKRLQFEEAVESIRAQVSEFRSTLKSSESRIPKAFPIQKIGISRMHAPNGVSTIRLSFVCPPFVDQEAILGRFVALLQKSGNQSGVKIQVVPESNPDAFGKPSSASIVEPYDQPSVNYVYASGHGSFQFLRGATSSTGSTFVFYKDEYLTPSEVDAVVGAYKEIFSYPNVHEFFKHDLEESRRRKLIQRSSQKPPSTPGGAKDEAIQQLQQLGIDVFEPSDDVYSLNWDSLAGYDDVKLEIEDTVVLALQNPQLYENIARKTRARYESNRPRAVLFEGPPGTGKTLSARIIAQQAGIPMIHIPIESVVSKWYGDSEKKMSAIFDACEKLDGAIIFIDEIDALAGDRSGGMMHEASRRILSVLLQKVEGFASAKKTTVVCATNRKQDLDSALISRFDLCIRYELPHENTRCAVFGRYAKQLSEEDLSQLAAVSTGLSCRDIKEICEYAERKWASKVLKNEVSEELPPLSAYMQATKTHLAGIGQHGKPAEIYEA